MKLPYSQFFNLMALEEDTEEDYLNIFEASGKFLFDGQLIELCKIINSAYLTSERNLWREGKQRIDLLELKKLIQSKELYVAEINGLIKGCIRLESKSNESCELGLLAVKPDYQGKGLGSKLINTVECDAKKKDFKYLELKIFMPSAARLVERENLLKWYESFGFRFESRVTPSSIDMYFKKWAKIPLSLFKLSKSLQSKHLR